MGRLGALPAALLVVIATAQAQQQTDGEPQVEATAYGERRVDSNGFTVEQLRYVLTSQTTASVPLRILCAEDPHLKLKTCRCADLGCDDVVATGTGCAHDAARHDAARRGDASEEVCLFFIDKIGANGAVYADHRPIDLFGTGTKHDRSLTHHRAAKRTAEEQGVTVDCCCDVPPVHIPPPCNADTCKSGVCEVEEDVCDSVVWYEKVCVSKAGQLTDNQMANQSISQSGNSNQSDCSRFAILRMEGRIQVKSTGAISEGGHYASVAWRDCSCLFCHRKKGQKMAYILMSS
eukprot:Selendium_serpulae@DN5947_c0_g1_i2.p1